MSYLLTSKFHICHQQRYSHNKELNEFQKLGINDQKFTYVKMQTLNYKSYQLNLGHAVAHLFEALHYKSEGHGLDSRL